MNLVFTSIVSSIPYILQGIGVTLKIVGVAALIGFAIGIFWHYVKSDDLKD